MFLEMCEEVLGGVFESLEECPLLFRRMMGEVRKAAGVAFPGKEYVALGGVIIFFLFYFFVCLFYSFTHYFYSPRFSSFVSFAQPLLRPMDLG